MGLGFNIIHEILTILVKNWEYDGRVYQLWVGFKKACIIQLVEKYCAIHLLRAQVSWVN
jgi:hypothetical protein